MPRLEEAAAGAANPHHHAVVVGIDEYPNGYRSLQGSVADAEAFAEWLTAADGGGLPESNVHLLLGARDRTGTVGGPTKEDIDSALKATVDQANATLRATTSADQPTVRAQTRLYLFVAGHGIMPQQGPVALLTARAEPSWPQNVELRSYADWLERNGTFGEICIFADCCRTLNVNAEPGRPTFLTNAVLRGQVLAIIGLAASAGQQAFEDEEAGDPDLIRGYFTTALLAGLQGGGYDPACGQVTSTELALFTAREVKRLTTNLGPGRQQVVDMPVRPYQPLLFGPAQHDGTPGPPRRQIRLEPPEGWTDDVEVVAPDGTTIPLQPDGQPWRLELPDGLYVVQRAGRPFDTTGLADDGVMQITEDRHVRL